MCTIADGAIVGSAIVSLVEKYGRDAKKPIYDFCKEMVDATL